MSAYDKARAYGVRFKSHKQSWLLAFLVFFWPALERRWITVGKTIYVPSGLLPYLYSDTISHEMEHVYQMEKLGVPLFLICYFFLPVPFGFAYFRWRWERAGYAHNIRSGRLSPADVADILWSKYFFTWPKPLMRKWLEANV